MKHFPLTPPLQSMARGSVLRCCGCDRERDTGREYCPDCEETTFSFVDDTACDVWDAGLHQQFRASALARGDLGFCPVVVNGKGVVA